MSLHLRLRVVLIEWLSQLKARERAKLLRKFPTGNIRRIRGKAIRSCLDTSTMIGSNSCAWIKEIKRDSRKWFSAIAPCRIHTESRLAISKA